MAEPLQGRHGTQVAPGSAEAMYAEAVRLEGLGAVESVDLYYEAAVAAWERIEGNLLGASPADPRHWFLYHSALTKLVMTSERFGRLRQPGVLATTGGPRGDVPVEYHGFPWTPADFRVLTPVGNYPADSVQHVYRSAGLGVTMMARGTPSPRPFLRVDHPFSATVILRPTGPPAPHGVRRPFALAFYNPLQINTISLGQQKVPIAADITAPIAFLLDGRDDNPITNFLLPGASRHDRGLFMFEPYQRGKIPIVFVHGLLSDPATWADLGNELRAHPKVVARYQFWTFSYDTGDPFLDGAEMLRRQLREIRTTLDPQGTDRALDNIVLVGHSMGGLIAKLQVCSSGDRLWSAVSSQPLDRIRTTPELRQHLAASFFFEPSPHVARVVFIGTPHRGSVWARMSIGRLGSYLVKEPSARRAAHRQLIQENPGVFSEEVRRRVPTSIDMLLPDSRSLCAIYQLPVDPRVTAHSIVGQGYWLPGLGDSDTVVPVRSASLQGVASEVRITAKHTELHRTEETVREMVRILSEHDNVRPMPHP